MVDVYGIKQSKLAKVADSESFEAITMYVLLSDYEKLEERIKKKCHRAFGLLTTLLPNGIVDVDDLMGLAQAIKNEIAELKKDQSEIASIAHSQGFHSRNEEVRELERRLKELVK